MIVVVDPSGWPMAASIAVAAAAANGTVEFVGKIADDADGDRRLHALSAAGVAHVATLRRPAGAGASTLDPSDIDLALRYLSDSTTIVMTDPLDARTVQPAADAASWGRGSLVLVLAAGQGVPEWLPEPAIVLEAPAADPEDAFAILVGTFAAGLDAGVDPGTAFAEAVASRAGWTPVDPAD
jgi:hypothetical protein